MLLQFAVENYLSFRDRAVLSLLADPRVTHEPGQVVDGPGGQKVLRAAALYGANGSGKSNLVKALGVLKRMALEGTRGDESLPVVPFKLDPMLRDAAAHFEIELVAAGKRYSYGLEATAKHVAAEWLYEVKPNGEERPLFEREAGSGAPRILLGDALGGEPERRAFLGYVAEGTRQNQPFLAEAGERNVTELEPIRAAIRQWDLLWPDTVYEPLIERIEGDDEFRNLMRLVLKEAGTGIDDLRVRREPIPPTRRRWLELIAESSTSEATYQIKGKGFYGGRKLRTDDQGGLEYANLVSIHRAHEGAPVELDMKEESDGTRRLLDLAPILHLMEQREADPLFVIDELERSLHPLLTRMLLQLFFARVGSGAATQIVFTTHDTNLLDVRVLSRDSVWLIEKDARGGSVMYPLSDLDQAQVDEVDRQGKGLERGYLQGRFGAIPFFGSLEALGFRKDRLR